MKSFAIAAAALLVAGAAVPASAAEFLGDYSITAHNSGDGLLIETSKIADFSTAGSGFNLTNAGDSTGWFNLFSIYTLETDVGPDDFVGKSISVNFQFTAPIIFDGQVFGTTEGESFLGIWENGSLNWGDVGYGDGVVQLAFGNGGLLQISLKDTEFNAGLFGLNEGPGHGGNVKAKFKLLSPSAAVPEPATWAMMIGGFGLVGAAMRRRSTKVSVTYA